MKERKKMKTTLLLLEDVINLGKKGDLAHAKPGFIRNYLIPAKKAVIADKRTIRMQHQLKKERELQAIQDKQEAENLAIRLKQTLLSITMKNDTQGNLYGSVTASDIIKALQQQEEVRIERKQVVIAKPIRQVGVYEISLKLKEQVFASLKLKVEGEVKVVQEKKRHQQVDNQVKTPEENENIKHHTTPLEK